MRISLALGLLLVATAPFAFTGCKEDISEDAYAIATKMTISDYLTSREDLSDIKAIFDEVQLGYSENASVLTSVLSARGNYTVFAPTNDAVALYVTEVIGETGKTVADLTLEQKERVALNCIIDNEDESAYELSDFPSNGAFPLSNLKDRRITSVQNTEGDYVINDESTVIESNLEASNGMLHIVDHVILPSDNTVAEMVQQAANMRIMGKLLTETGWADSLTLKTEDEEQYEIDNQSSMGSTRTVGSAGSIEFMESRAIGYTMFVETDQVLNADWGITLPVYDEQTEEITNWETIKAEIQAKCAQYYDDTDADDFTSPYNAVNRFVAYHLLDGKMAMENRDIVHHFNEYNYDVGADQRNPQENTYSINVWDYYTTKCRYIDGEAYGRCLLKVTQLPTGEHDFYLNRVSEYNDGFDGNYVETGLIENTPSNGLNVKVSKTNEYEGVVYDNNASNGFYFPINHVLVNSSETQDALGSERMRIDVVTVLPEILSNSLRGRGQAYFPLGYFKNIMSESSDTQIAYLQNGYAASSGAWRDYQGDELLILGTFDFVFRLPPVPKSGTYELRLGVSNNSLRTMVQVYLGDAHDATYPVGLPIDQRELPSDIPGNPWVSDEDAGYDEVVCRENDRNLRNQGYMKGPNYFCASQLSGGRQTNTVRNIEGSSASGPALRRILTAQRFDKDKTYYLRFKGAISDYAAGEFYFDYIEFVPSSVYNNDANPEDIW